MWNFHKWFERHTLILLIGILVVVSIGGCLLAAFLLLPSLCVVFKPGFAEPKKG